LEWGWAEPAFLLFSFVRIWLEFLCCHFFLLCQTFLSLLFRNKQHHTHTHTQKQQQQAEGMEKRQIKNLFCITMKCFRYSVRAVCCVKGSFPTGIVFAIKKGKASTMTTILGHERSEMEWIFLWQLIALFSFRFIKKHKQKQEPQFSYLKLVLFALVYLRTLYLWSQAAHCSSGTLITSFDASVVSFGNFRCFHSTPSRLSYV